MATKKPNSEATPEADVKAPLMVNAQYVKDLSFENPAPLTNITGNEERPSISIHIEAQAHNLADRSFEVTLRIRVDAKKKEAQVFLLDLEYAGAFTIGEEVPEEYLRPILMIECPRILFPFARNIVSMTTQEGGYPALLLTPVDFADLYQRQVAQEQSQEEKSKRPEILQ
ncbi:MAG: protein-export chaperone SecB [Alphaproteobacteria bacterium 41-28]|nr:MAG: protein-export chaperone SecB [Alphaproteobacteria bacterium 41-28]